MPCSTAAPSGPARSRWGTSGLVQRRLGLPRQRRAAGGPCPAPPRSRGPRSVDRRRPAPVGARRAGRLRPVRLRGAVRRHYLGGRPARARRPLPHLGPRPRPASGHRHARRETTLRQPSSTSPGTATSASSCSRTARGSRPSRRPHRSRAHEQPTAAAPDGLTIGRAEQNRRPPDDRPTGRRRSCGRRQLPGARQKASARCHSSAAACSSYSSGRLGSVNR